MIIRPTLEDLFFNIGKTLAGVDPLIKLSVKQAMIPTLVDSDDWVTFDLLSVVQYASRWSHEEDHIMLQIVTYSKHAEFRVDKSPGAIYTLTDKYKNVLNQVTMPIEGKDWCVQWKEPRVSFIDNRLMGDFSKVIYQQSPEMKTMSGVIFIEGTVVTN